MTTYYVDGTNGNDSNNGTSLGTAKLTVSSALNASAIGDLVYIRKGVYTDTWPTGNVIGRDIRAYNGEDVTIDCQGSRACLNATTNTALTTSMTTGAFYLRMVGLKFVNYTGTLIQIPIAFISPTVEWTIENCFFKPAGSLGRGISAGAQIGFTIRIDNCTFINHVKALYSFAPYTNTLRNCIFDNNTFNIDNGDGGTDIINDSGQQANWAEKDYNAFPGNTVESHPINTNSTAIGFNNSGSGDYSLSASSALRGLGKYGDNVGATFNPVIRIDGDLAFNALSAGSNDELYYNTNTNMPGTEGPTDAGPVVFSNSVWKINNVAVPGAKSARVHFGPYTLPDGSTLSMLGWSGLEDTTPSPGSKTVIDFTGGTSARDIQISVNGGAKQVFGKTTDLSQPAGTIDFYVTLRSDGV